MNKVWRYIKPYKKKMIAGLSIKTVGTLMDLVIPWLLSYIIDKIIPAGDIKKVVLFGVAMIFCAFIAVFGNVTGNRIAVFVAKESTKNIRHDMFEKISYMSSSEIDKFTIPTLISRMTSDTYTIHSTVGMLQRMGIRAPILLIGGIGVTLFLDPVLSLAMIAVLPLATILTVIVSKTGVKFYRKLQIANDNMIRVVRENAAGIRVIKALSKSEHERMRFNDVNEKLTLREKNAALVMSIVNPVISLIMNGGFIVVIVIGAYRVQSGTSEIGKIIAFLTYFTLIVTALMSITRIFTMTSKAIASADRISEILDAETEKDIFTSVKDDEQPSDSITVCNDIHIQMKDVSFSYEKSKFLIDNINVSIPRCSTLGIIGVTGSGKSTLAGLLMRFYDIQSGQILIDGKDIKDMTAKELRGKFGVVFQNDTLFKSTIRENIKLGRNANDDALLDAATYAQAYDFITRAGGLDGDVAIKGMNFSGGQRQRLLLTRALAGKPEILILDDASSALDYKTDALLRSELEQHYKESTKIIITQRISSIMHAQQIMVMDKGKVIALGKHEQLIQTCALYKEISLSQLGGEVNAT